MQSLWFMGQKPEDRFHFTKSIFLIFSQLHLQPQQSLRTPFTHTLNRFQSSRPFPECLEISFLHLKRGNGLWLRFRLSSTELRDMRSCFMKEKKASAPKILSQKTGLLS